MGALPTACARTRRLGINRPDVGTQHRQIREGRTPGGDGGRALAVTAALHIDAVGLPAGVTATPIEIAAGQTEAVLALSADAGGTLGPIAIQIAATAVDDAAVADDADVALMVADPPGTLDETFDNDGITTLMLAATTDRIEAIVLQSTGRIVVLAAIGTARSAVLQRRADEQ